jgi:hypothetical protein
MRLEECFPVASHCKIGKVLASRPVKLMLVIVSILFLIGIEATSDEEHRGENIPSHGRSATSNQRSRSIERVESYLRVFWSDFLRRLQRGGFRPTRMIRQPSAWIQSRFSGDDRLLGNIVAIRGAQKSMENKYQKRSPFLRKPDRCR